MSYLQHVDIKRVGMDNGSKESICVIAIYLLYRYNQNRKFQAVGLPLYEGEEF